MYKYLKYNLDNEWGLGPLQDKLLEIIIDINDFCNKKNIKYTLAFGSVLGAVRHKGFIPWDDDMDIYMTYDDYLKFKNTFEIEYKDKYVIQEWDKNGKYFTFSKVRMNNTTYIEDLTKNKKNFHMGIGIDIFILHNAKKNLFCKFNQFFWSKYIVLKTITDRGYKRNDFFWKNILKLFKLLPKNFLVKFGLKQIYKYTEIKSDYLFSSFGSEMYDKVFFSVNEVYPPKFLDFEKIKLPVPHNYENYLKKFYGDYKKIPNLDYIKTHQHTSFYDVEKDYTFYIKK